MSRELPVLIGEFPALYCATPGLTSATVVSVDTKNFCGLLELFVTEPPTVPVANSVSETLVSVPSDVLNGCKVKGVTKSVGVDANVALLETVKGVACDAPANATPAAVNIRNFVIKLLLESWRVDC